MINALQAQVDTPSPAAIAKSLDQTSKLSIEGNPFESLANLNPADQSTETVIEACIILAKSVMDFWRQYGSWLLDLKRRMEAVSYTHLDVYKRQAYSFLRLSEEA